MQLTMALNRSRIHILGRERYSLNLSVLIDKLDSTSKTFHTFVARYNATLYGNNESRNQKRRHKNIIQLVIHWDWKRERNKRVEISVWMWVWPSFLLSFILYIFILLGVIKSDVFCFNLLNYGFYSLLENQMTASSSIK